ncbi:MAG TPA: LysR substrate-binding domain-containing protein, partial [Bordetella sp.]
MLSSLLAAFYETARQGGVTAAARQLSVSQPTVTTRIQQLEARYGVTLFHRRGSRLELTQTGAGLMPLVRQMLQIQGDIDFKLRNAHELQGGSLHIGTTGPHYIVSTIAAFRRQYPNAHIGIEVGNSLAVLESLFEHRVDIAVASQPLADSRVLQYEIASDPLVLVAHRDHPLARRSTVTFQDMS